MALREYYEDLKAKSVPADDFRQRVAEACGVSENTVYRWLSGKIVPDKLKRQAIAQIAGVSESELFPLEDD